MDAIDNLYGRTAGRMSKNVLHREERNDWLQSLTVYVNGGGIVARDHRIATTGT
jgi:hypothetical protein